MSIAAELHALQDIDLALDRVLGRLQEIEEGLEETEELRAAREVMDEQTKLVEALKARQTELEWEVDEVRTKGGRGGKTCCWHSLSRLRMRSPNGLPQRVSTVK
jgi:predicted  nucleic acid-binding Zn-ribbon protein